ncbi:TIR domain-containing protein [Algoriphagus alkaliphilus]|uniref:TIR domain-containing protein n=1 Tax=Algoriphagus alkaliphilus TaxID=279824 RepID=A0A1G5YLP2_9BACT|nr:toll/interleukin-1 receptor domain-containing protein [Algoriphagus alkaliphilus]SDA83728.1 TIR domain-containing protein [Algoriphagus alkaliphilus]
MGNGKIFISYRREDTSGESGRLKDKLEQIFGQENIFYDVETLEAGLNFDQSIAKALNDSKVLLAMIGPHWLKVSDSTGTKRIQKPDDWVRKEIAEALKRELRVIPVLVNGAEMPDSDELPDDLKELSLKHAQELTSSRWNYDVGKLTEVLEKLITKKPEPTPEPRPTPRPFVPPISKPKSWWARNYLWALGGIVGFLILVGMCVPEENIYPDPFTIENTDVGTENKADIRTENPGGDDIYNSLQLDSKDPAPTQPKVDSPDYFDISGYWILQDLQGNQSTLAFSQNGSEFAFYEYNILNVQIGYGSGRIEGNKLNSDYFNSFVGIGGQIQMSTGNSGKSWTGQVIFPSAGSSSQITLTRN